MLDKAKAEAFAAEWIDAWNSHDLKRVLGHYDDGFEMSSPFIVQIAGEPSGRLRGKRAVGDYWTKALARNPDLHFELEMVLWGVNSLVIHYQRVGGGKASEWFELGDDGKVIRSAAHYAA